MSIRAISGNTWPKLWRNGYSKRTIHVASLAQEVNYCCKFRFPEKNQIQQELKSYFHNTDYEKILDKVSAILQNQLFDLEQIKIVVTGIMLENRVPITECTVMDHKKMVALLMTSATLIETL